MSGNRVPCLAGIPLTLRIVAVCAGLLPFVRPDHAAGAGPELARISAAINRQRTSVHSLYLSYHYKNTLDKQAFTTGKGRSIRIDESVVLAMTGAKRFQKVQYKFLNDKNQEVPVERVAVYDGEKCTVVEGKNAQIEQAKSSFTEMCSYISMICWSGFFTPATPKLERIVNGEGWLPECLSHPDWRLAPTRTIRGIRCTVLENATLGNRMFFDPAKNYALVRREKTKSFMGDIASYDTDYLNHAYLTPSLWLPRRISAKISYKDGGTETVDWTVDKLSCSAVDENLFRTIHFRPGTLVADSINKVIYIYDEGPEVLETAVARTAFEHRVSAVRLGPPVRWALGAIGFILIGGGVVLFRIKRGRWLS